MLTVSAMAGRRHTAKLDLLASQTDVFKSSITYEGESSVVSTKHSIGSQLIGDDTEGNTKTHSSEMEVALEAKYQNSVNKGIKGGCTDSGKF